MPPGLMPVNCTLFDSVLNVSRIISRMNRVISLGRWTAVETHSGLCYVGNEFFITILRNSFPETADLTSSSRVEICNLL
jgi:hypothetical protein